MGPTNRGKGDTVLKYATVAASTLRDVADSSPVPFLRIIAAVSMSILSIVQSVRSNREECMRMISHIDELISVILRLCIKEDDLSPATLHNIGRFADTLQKIHSYVTSQQNTSLLKRLFRQSENAALLEACNSGLRHALDVFGVESSLVTTSEMADMRGQAEKRHKELVELFAGQSEPEETDTAVSLGTKQFFELGNSTTSLVLLPATPKIFRGRGRELDELVDLLLQNCSRVAILGPGGIGKTALATSALHHPAVCAKYIHRHFISCESAANHDDLVSLIASHLELSPSRNISKVIFRHFSGRPASILVLDNFETSWEPPGSRSQVEDFLSLLTDIPHLALSITMRGAERPGSVRWSRPFLPPLEPLSDAAARETFTDIADEKHHDADIRELLKLTNNLPLAVNLVANIAAFEGYETVLSRWKDEKTTLLSEGPDKRSNLDLSIRLSLSSPRMLDSPGALSLLSLLSLLPDGISDAELLQSDFPIPGMGRSKTTLMRTSLAYLDHDKRLRVLSPIREYILIHDNPTPSLCRPLRQHFHRLIMLWKDYQHLSTAGITQRIAANLGNFHAVLAHGLHWDEPDLAQTLFSIIAFDSFYRISGRRSSGMLELVTPYLEHLKDPRLYSAYLGQFVQT
ncbi:P-loop containing nucleoside triphosphate hydrolase protein [Mycena polygramma]|nr:P-loop containing nucleoside triphosphate hydrolase protein [Mycena polygramma]